MLSPKLQKSRGFLLVGHVAKLVERRNAHNVLEVTTVRK
jgi:hypothetical protein